MLAITRSPAVVVCFAALAALAPRSALQAWARTRHLALRAVWPDVSARCSGGQGKRSLRSEQLFEAAVVVSRPSAACDIAEHYFDSNILLMDVRIVGA